MYGSQTEYTNPLQGNPRWLKQPLILGAIFTALGLLLAWLFGCNPDGTPRREQKPPEATGTQGKGLRRK